MNSKELRSRWKQGVGASAHEAIVRSLQRQESIADRTPFEMIDNRADFRGWSVGALRGIKGAELYCLDLSYCDLTWVRLTDCRISDVQFIKSLMREFSDEGNLYENCQFQEVSFRGSHFGLRRSQFTNCKFERCDFSKLRFAVVEFNKCIFDSCKLNGVDFGGSSFAEVEFIGRLEDVWFRGRDPFVDATIGPNARARTNEMTEVSFRQADLWDLTFSDNCSLSKTTPPDDGEHFFFDRWQERLEFALKMISPLGNARARNFVASFLPHAKKQSEFIINRRAIIADLGDELGRKVLDSLQSAF